MHISVLFSLYMYIHIHTYTYVYTYKYTSISLSLYIYIYIYISLSLYIYIYIHIHILFAPHGLLSDVRQGGRKMSRTSCLDVDIHIRNILQALSFSYCSCSFCLSTNYV